MGYYKDYPALQVRMKEIIQEIIKTSPNILVGHEVVDPDLKRFVRKCQYGIDQKQAVPADFPDFPVGFISVFWCHGYIYLTVSELVKENIEEAAAELKKSGRKKQAGEAA